MPTVQCRCGRLVHHIWEINPISKINEKCPTKTNVTSVCIEIHCLDLLEDETGNNIAKLKCWVGLRLPITIIHLSSWAFSNTNLMMSTFGEFGFYYCLCRGNFYLPYSVTRIVWSRINLFGLHFAWQDWSDFQGSQTHWDELNWAEKKRFCKIIKSQFKLIQGNNLLKCLLVLCFSSCSMV